MARLAMFRVRLALTIGISFGFVVFLGFVLYWGSQQISAYFYGSQAAYEAFDRYERLSQQAYRHFKQRMDLLLVDNEASMQDVESSRRRLYDAIDELRNAITADSGALADAASPVQQSVELERIAKFTAFLETGMYRFDEVEQLRRQGKRDKAMLLLSEFSEREIDRKFQPLIDAAIGDERTKAMTAQEKLGALIERLRWIAILAASLAAGFGLVAGTVLFKGVKRPIEALLRGTEEIAAGHLAYRIPRYADDEFGYLAGHFNEMAQTLEIQQDHLQEAQAVLEQKVADRTLELSQLNGQLQRLNQARLEFFADISHELRTPLTVIRGEAEVTLRAEDRDTEEYRDALHRILDLSMQLGKLVNDLLFMARAETATLQFEWDAVELTELVSGAVEDLQVLAQDKSIAVRLDAPESPIWVRGDKQRLRQILFILGDNACRYSDEGGRIDVRLHSDGANAQLQIIDHGIGIPEADQDVIFDRYFRSANAQRAGDQGMGLGLPMAKSIVTAHGGRITASGAEGEGATFTVSLPQLSCDEAGRPAADILLGEHSDDGLDDEA